jgi:hypothetical protein
MWITSPHGVKSEKEQEIFEKYNKLLDNFVKDKVSKLMEGTEKEKGNNK